MSNRYILVVGTPSILEKNDIESIIDSLRDNFNIDEVIEITLECNPTM